MYILIYPKGVKGIKEKRKEKSKRKDTNREGKP
jgi:hypothetical protein